MSGLMISLLREAAFPESNIALQRTRLKWAPTTWAWAPRRAAELRR